MTQLVTNVETEQRFVGQRQHQQEKQDLAKPEHSSGAGFVTFTDPNLFRHDERKCFWSGIEKNVIFATKFEKMNGKNVWKKNEDVEKMQTAMNNKRLSQLGFLVESEPVSERVDLPFLIDPL